MKERTDRKLLSFEQKFANVWLKVTRADGKIAKARAEKNNAVSGVAVFVEEARAHADDLNSRANVLHKLANDNEIKAKG